MYTQFFHTQLRSFDQPEGFHKLLVIFECLSYSMLNLRCFNRGWLSEGGYSALSKNQRPFWSVSSWAPKITTHMKILALFTKIELLDFPVSRGNWLLVFGFEEPQNMHVGPTENLQLCQWWFEVRVVNLKASEKAKQGISKWANKLEAALLLAAISKRCMIGQLVLNSDSPCGEIASALFYCLACSLQNVP